MKATIPAAGSMLVIRVLAKLLDTDPEIADEYLFRFTKKWGKDKLHNVIAFLEKVEQDAIPDDIAKRTLELDLFYAGDDASKLTIPEPLEET